MIEEVQIATNRYAPPGAQAINMYLIDGEQLTLGQLTIAVCIKAAFGGKACDAAEQHRSRQCDSGEHFCDSFHDSFSFRIR